MLLAEFSELASFQHVLEVSERLHEYHNLEVELLA